MHPRPQQYWNLKGDTHQKVMVRALHFPHRPHAGTVYAYPTLYLWPKKKHMLLLATKEDGVTPPALFVVLPTLLAEAEVTGFDDAAPLPAALSASNLASLTDAALADVPLAIVLVSLGMYDAIGIACAPGSRRE